MSERLTTRRSAVITGGSSGLGLAFARQLAKEGFSLILAARREEVLGEVKRQLEAEYNVPVEVFRVDLSQESEIRRLEDRIKELARIDYLVNAAGFGIGGQVYPDHNLDRSSDMLRVHCLATQRLSCAAAQKMKTVGAGNIINIASVAAFLTSRGAVDYSSTKAFIVSFTKGLACDLKGTGVRAEVLCPGFVRTGFHATEEMKPDADLYNRLPRWLWLNADWVARKSLAAIRRRRPKTVYIPSILYKIVSWTLKRFA